MSETSSTSARSLTEISEARPMQYRHTNGIGLTRSACGDSPTDGARRVEGFIGWTTDGNGPFARPRCISLREGQSIGSKNAAPKGRRILYNPTRCSTPEALMNRTRIASRVSSVFALTLVVFFAFAFSRNGSGAALNSGAPSSEALVDPRAAVEVNAATRFDV